MTPGLHFSIEDYDEADFEQVAHIYQQGIDGRNATFETQVKNQTQWQNSYLQGSKLVVRQDEQVLGWAGLSSVSTRHCYRGVAEATLYVANQAQGQGVGLKLLRALVERSEHLGLWMLQSTIFERNPSSIRLHEKCGFRIVGTRERIAQLDGEWLDVVLMERRSKSVDTV